MRSIFCTEPSKYLRSWVITSSHRPSFFRSLTRYSLTTVNSPERFDFTCRFWYVGSIDCDTPVMLAMVAVGAMAMVLLLRMPTVLMRSRRLFQSNLPEGAASCFRYLLPRCLARIWIESIGRMPWSQSEPLNVEYAPRSCERSVL